LQPALILARFNSSFMDISVVAVVRDHCKNCCIIMLS